MVSENHRSLDSQVDSETKNNITYKPKPSIVDLSEKYDLPAHGSTDCDFDRVKELLFKSQSFWTTVKSGTYSWISEPISLLALDTDIQVFNFDKIGLGVYLFSFFF